MVGTDTCAPVTCTSNLKLLEEGLVRLLIQRSEVAIEDDCRTLARQPRSKRLLVMTGPGNMSWMNQDPLQA